MMQAANREAEIHIGGNATLRCETVPNSNVSPAVKPIIAQAPKT
jgi:hypothetical protein